MPKTKIPKRCDCDSSQLYRECCRPLHRGDMKAATAEQLMRSRYSAYSRNLYQYIHQTWAHENRPDINVLRAESTNDVKWCGLEILLLEAGQSGDTTGVVEFHAKYSKNSVISVIYERSVFVYQENSWFYLKAE